MDPSTRITSQLHAEIADGPWTSVVMWQDDDPYGPSNGLIFEVGEPVCVDRRAWGAGLDNNVDEDSPLVKQIYWITKLREGINGHEVSLGKTRGASTFVTMAVHMRKLGPLRRLAAEGSDGPCTI